MESVHAYGRLTPSAVQKPHFRQVCESLRVPLPAELARIVACLGMARCAPLVLKTLWAIFDLRTTEEPSNPVFLFSSNSLYKALHFAYKPVLWGFGVQNPKTPFLCDLIKNKMKCHGPTFSHRLLKFYENELIYKIHNKAIRAYGRTFGPTVLSKISSPREQVHRSYVCQP